MWSRVRSKLRDKRQKEESHTSWGKTSSIYKDKVKGNQNQQTNEEYSGQNTHGNTKE